MGSYNCILLWPIRDNLRQLYSERVLKKIFFFPGRLKYLTLTDPTKVWMPDTFFRNEKEARKHEIIVPNVYVRIFPDGEILYSIRYDI